MDRPLPSLPTTPEPYEPHFLHTPPLPPPLSPMFAAFVTADEQIRPNRRTEDSVHFFPERVTHDVARRHERTKSFGADGLRRLANRLRGGAGGAPLRA